MENFQKKPLTLIRIRRQKILPHNIIYIPFHYFGYPIPFLNNLNMHYSEQITSFRSVRHYFLHTFFAFKNKTCTVDIWLLIK